MAGARNNFRNIELAAARPGGGFERNCFVYADDREAVEAWRKRHHNRDVYASVCRFERPDRKSPFACPFFADFDATDPRDAAPEVLKACELLRDRIGIDPNCVELHFSGAKGFHLSVPLPVFGDVVAPEALRVWRELGWRLAHEGVHHLDLGIYQSSRVLRLPNSINSKSGLYKIPVEYEELRDLGMDHILNEAKRARDEDSLAVPGECPRAAHWFYRAMACVRRSRSRSTGRSRRRRGFQRGWRMPPCIRRLERATLPDGLRHAAYFALACFYAQVDMHPAEAERRLREIDGRHPIRDPGYLFRVVDCGRNHAGFPSCSNPALRRYCDPDRCFLARRRRDRIEKAQGHREGASGQASSSPLRGERR